MDKRFRGPVKDSTPGFGDGLPEIITMGRSIFDPIWAEREHTPTQAELVHVLAGQARVVTRDYTITAHAGDTVYTPSAVAHRDVFAPGTVYETYLIQFTWNGESAMLDRFSPVELASRSGPARTQISARFEQMYHDFVTDLPYARVLIAVQVQEILYRMCQSAASARGEPAGREGFSHARRMQIISEARRIIRARYHEPITLDMIADALDISPYYLSRVFSSESGFTLSSFLTQVRMEGAAEALGDSRKTIAQVALACGFQDAHYFSRVFKAHFNMSPKAYRTKLLERT